MKRETDFVCAWNDCGKKITTGGSIPSLMVNGRLRTFCWEHYKIARETGKVDLDADEKMPDLR